MKHTRRRNKTRDARLKLLRVMHGSCVEGMARNPEGKGR